MLDMTLRAATQAERLYAFAQSQQIGNCCGSPGYLRGVFNDGGTQFHLQWEQDLPSGKTPDFLAELDQVINALHYRDEFGHLFQEESSMVAFCQAHQEAGFEGGFAKEYAFRADTPDYTYLIRCVPEGGGNQGYVFPYRRKWLDRHMKDASMGIRFIGADFKESFRIPDGDSIRIIVPTGEHRDRVCRYIDGYHMEVVGSSWDSIYHINQFAEEMARLGNKVIPLRSSLPERCYHVLAETGEVIVLEKGSSGYFKSTIDMGSREENQALVDEYNEKLGVSKAQVEAMSVGSMFGWDVPGADPGHYNDQGLPIKPKQQSRGDAR